MVSHPFLANIDNDTDCTSNLDTGLQNEKSVGLPMLRNLSSYWQTNIYETTSGNFVTDLLEFHIGRIGKNRIMYSVDYPFVRIEDGAEWVNSLAGVLDEEGLTSLKRGVAIELLRLND